jgi:hypothetical protein
MLSRLAGFLAATAALAPAAADGQTPVSATTSRTRGPIVTDSSVGYIDNAIPGTVFRFRYDTAYNNPRPTRAEFFYPKGGFGGRGLPLPERSVDYQELSTSFEFAVGERTSAFVEGPWRLLNPDLNANHEGFSDLTLGLKYAFVFEEDLIATFQFRTYVPTGDNEHGLGTDHVSLEPALLVYQRLDDRLALAGEFRVWVPIDGTDFAGEVLRYGIGLHYDLVQADAWRLTPVAEVVGWTVLDGKTGIVHPSGLSTTESADGDTIVNGKFGLRLHFGGCRDLYFGYGRALTGDTWYEDIYRVELRFAF